MKTSLLVCLMLAVYPITIRAQDEQLSEEDNKWIEAAAPNEMHEMMASWNGEWEEQITMWIDPEGPPTKNTAIAVNSMILGGRYQKSVHTGSFSGMPFEGISIMGYDKIAEKFVSTWVDNFGLGIMYMEGTWDDNSRSITLFGESMDPLAGEIVRVKETFRVVDENTQEMYMYTLKGGEEIKTMEIIFTRKK